MSKPQKEIKKNGFEQKLQEIIWDLFLIKLSIVYSIDYTQVSDEKLPCISFVTHYGLSDPYSGTIDDFVISLEGFVRPDNQEKLIFNLNYSIHNLSGQMDYWNVQVEGALDSEKELFMDLINPYGWNGCGVWTSNYIGINIKWNSEVIQI